MPVWPLVLRWRKFKQVQRTDVRTQRFAQVAVGRWRINIRFTSSSGSKVPTEQLAPVTRGLSGVLATPTVSLAHARLLVQVCAQRGVAPERLLSDAGLPLQLLDREQGEVYAAEYACLIQSALSLTQDPCLGLEFGLSMPVRIPGPLGQALLSAGSLADALEVAVTYWGLMGRYMEVRLDRFEHEAHLTVRERMPLGPLQRFALESMMAGWIHVGRQLAGMHQRSSDTVVCFTLPRIDAFDRYASRMPVVRFDCPSNQILMYWKDLDLSLPQGHPEAARLARAACDAEQDRLKERRADFVQQVGDALALSSEGYPTMAEVAQRLSVTSRTLARHLERHGVTFRQVIDQHRHQEACTLLSTTLLPVDEIAVRLGYNDPANFTRAFRRWADCSPSQYRTRQREARG